ncbi:MAG: c-type cytochrome, partial [Sphingobacteriales bacterium]
MIFAYSRSSIISTMKIPQKKTAIIAAIILVLGWAETSARIEKDDSKITHRNLRVIPRNTSDEELIAIMRNINKSLGVKCNYCHAEKAGAAGKDGRPEMDFASDAKPQKKIARKMMRMTEDVNDRLEDIGDHEFERAHAV